MITEETVLAALRQVEDPELHRDVISLGMIKDIRVSDGRVALTLVLTTPACPVRQKFEEDVRTAVAAIPGVTGVELSTTAQVRSLRGFDQPSVPGVQNVVAIASGKGGVGKSTVSVNLAAALAREGARVGLLDADIYGPNVPLMMGLSELPPMQGGKIVPAENFGVKVMSMGFLIKPSEAVIWRGPMLHGAVTKFLKEVLWGDLDYLLVDLPPGCLTADTLVSTEHGPVPISRIQPGTQVYSFDGSVGRQGKAGWKFQGDLVKRNVLAVIPQGKAKVYELKTSTRLIRGTEDHPLLVLRRVPKAATRYYDYRLTWVELAHVRPDDRLLVVKKLPQSDGKPLRLPPLKAPARIPLDIPEYTSDSLTRLFGYFLGDGFVRLANGKSWGVWFSEPEGSKYRNIYEQLLKDSFGLKRIHQQSSQFAALSVQVSELFDKLGLRKGALEKSVPDWVYTLPVSQKSAMIEGFCDADGHRRRTMPGHRRAGWMCFESPNRKLMTGIRNLCLDVGLKAGNLNARTRETRLPSTGRIATSTFWGFEANRSTKTSRYGAGLMRGPIGRGLEHDLIGFETIRSIQPLGEEEVFDLQVEGEHNFVANGLIVHNTGDVQLSLCQVISMSGALIVTTPQDVALLDVVKAISMFEKVKVPILGVVENMSGFICPHCSKETAIFDKGGAIRAAEKLKLPFLGEVPLMMQVREGGDTGHPVVLTHPDSAPAKAFTEVARKLAAQISVRASGEEAQAKTVWKV